MSAPLNAKSSSPPQTPANGSQVKFKVKLSSQSKSDWLAGSLTTAKLIAAGAECIPFPYVKGVFGMVIIILETVEKVKRNRDDLKELCEDIVEIIGIVQGRLSSHADTTAVEFRRLCEKLEGVLEDVLQSIKKLPAGARGLRSRFKEVMKLGSTADKIAGYQMRIQKLQSNFMLMATIDTNLQVHKGFSKGRLPDSSATPATQTITKCPPPSRIFHGRQNILDKMHQFFTQDLDKQHIFLLYGLGGAGKTQSALKFIQEFSAHFTYMFLIDASTTETIDTGLKNIAATRNAGNTAQEALEWLSSKPAEWLLFFDNADDPRINLNKFFPHCKHGNILITSRNPRLRVYAESDYLVSAMEETDAVELLLKSAAQAITPGNKKIAAQIVETLYYFPLAIIQAGAFIAKSGVLSGYLTLYAENQARLLSEQPDQTHDDYAQTVYTTWQISFKQLSKPAATILQLCSFLHHNGISEEIFSRASLYEFPFNGPSKEELHDPLEFLSQFSEPTGVWNSLHFLDVMNEITSYSLANFDPDGKLYSIHPLVHDWSRSTLTDKKQYHYWMVAIVGMSISGIPNQDLQLASLMLLPHVDSLLCGNIDIKPDFRSKYGLLYYHAERMKDAEQLELAVLEHQRSVMGNDHLDTLHAMGSVASTYHSLGKLQEAQELEVVVFEKQREILGEDHPDTLNTMANLAIIYSNLGKLKEAEELEVVVLEKRGKILGEDHPHTLETRDNLASIYHSLGKLQEAEELEVVVLEKQRKILGEDHPDTLRTMGNLTSTYISLGKLKEAEELGLVVLEKQRNILGEDHPDTLRTIKNLASTYYNLGKLLEAEELEVVVLEKRRRILGENHPDSLRAMAYLAFTYHDLGKLKEAEQIYIELLDRQTTLLGPHHPDTLGTAGSLAQTRKAMDKKQRKSAIKFSHTKVTADCGGALSNKLNCINMFELRLIRPGLRLSSIYVYRDISDGTDSRTKPPDLSSRRHQPPASQHPAIHKDPLRTLHPHPILRGLQSHLGSPPEYILHKPSVAQNGAPHNLPVASMTGMMTRTTCVRCQECEDGPRPLPASRRLSVVEAPVDDSMPQRPTKQRKSPDLHQAASDTLSGRGIFVLHALCHSRCERRVRVFADTPPGTPQHMAHAPPPSRYIATLCIRRIARRYILLR
ncbi:hypothetical protein DFH09DRAFT_1282005 [Mycena vulgaris]|nr:hypothetical protein DFH09DRAFT_1282005 [Mycena vulgaris]